MARIPEDEIERVKRQTDLVVLARSRGIEMAKHGSKDFVGRCPFHDDKESPNFIISPEKGLYHCMACGVAGNAIQFVEKFDGVSFRHAYELLSDGGKAAFERAESRPLKGPPSPSFLAPWIRRPTTEPSWTRSPITTTADSSKRPRPKPTSRAEVSTTKRS